MIDLHVHSNQSDGSFSLREILEKAESEGVKTLAKCDHDTTAGNDEFISLSPKYGVKGIPGVEISADWKNGNCHILGLGLSSHYKPLEEALFKIRDSRNGRNEQIIEKLNDLGLAITVDEVSHIAGGEVMGRPHMSRLMKDKGYVETTQEAFDKYLAKGKPAYVDRYRLDPAEAVKLLHEASAKVVLAHPTQLKLDQKGLEELIEKLKPEGLSGIEVYTYYADDSEVELYKKIASEFSLFITGGSDFHGESKPDHELGYYRTGIPIPDECSEIFYTD